MNSKYDIKICLYNNFLYKSFTLNDVNNIENLIAIAMLITINTCYTLKSSD